MMPNAGTLRTSCAPASCDTIFFQVAKRGRRSSRRRTAWSGNSHPQVILGRSVSKPPAAQACVACDAPSHPRGPIAEALVRLNRRLQSQCGPSRGPGSALQLVSSGVVPVPRPSRGPQPYIRRAYTVARGVHACMTKVYRLMPALERGSPVSHQTRGRGGIRSDY